MEEAGLTIKVEPYTMKVPRSQRGGEIIEPMISTQWFVKIKPLAEPAIEAVRDGRIQIVPEHFTKVYYNWMENIEDWCISRQLWWGHRIPVWYCDDCGTEMASRQDLEDCTKCGSENICQDPDVLDTWFSSGLWPFSTLGWPEETPDLKYFYPTAMMETGYDILFFWVARMIMSGLEYTDQVPFHIVYLHGLIRDEHGQKMSKSKGNVIDPLIVMDELGTDALRFTLLVGSTPGNDMNLSTKKVEANRNFANKVWNAGRFIIGSLEKAPSEPENDPDWTLADSWIWARLNELVRDVDRLFTGYQYGEAGRQIYEFFWSDFADWYIEIAKHQIDEGGDRAFYTAHTLVRVLDTCLRLLHPFTPFVTEELWGHLKDAATAHSTRHEPKGGWEKALIIAAFPEPRTTEGWEDDKVADFTLLQDVVRAIRNYRAEKKVKPSQKLPAHIAGGEKFEMLKAEEKSIVALANLDPDLLILAETLEEKPEEAASLVVAGVEIYLPLSEIIDRGEEKQRLQADLEKAQSQVERLEKLLSGPFGDRAPAKVVEKEQAKLETFRDTVQKLEQQLKRL
jgi:valyl-tRNA synthetase